ncbi:MAG: iron-containing alcohol dehydrogenase [Desulfobacterales bacterium]
MIRMASVFQTVPKIVFGCGVVKQLGEAAKAIGASRVAVVTDPGIVQAKVHEPVLAALEKAGLHPDMFAAVEPDPRIEIVNDCLSFIRSHKADLVVGLGGGSSLDISKAAAVMNTNEGPIQKYAGVNLVPKPGLPTLLIPTTAGTGSEVTSISVLSDTVNKVKVGVVSDYMFARTVLLDPELTLGLPPQITASTGLDALIHAIESYTGCQASFITEPLAMAAIRRIARHLRTAYARGSSLEARSGMLKASLLAGMAFANTQTAGAHACALSLGGKFHVPHGIATSLMLPAIMRFNSIAAPEKFADIAEAFGETTDGLAPMDKAQKAIDGVVGLIGDVGFKLGLENYGVSREDIDDLAKGAMTAVRLWNNNPRSATEEQVRDIFADSF